MKYQTMDKKEQIKERCQLKLILEYEEKLVSVIIGNVGDVYLNENNKNSDIER